MKKTDLEKLKAMKLAGRLKQDQALRGKKPGADANGPRRQSRLLSAILSAGEVSADATLPSDGK